MDAVDATETSLEVDMQVESFIYTNGGLEPIEFKVFFLADCKVNQHPTGTAFYNPMDDALDIGIEKVEVTGIDYNDEMLNEESEAYKIVKSNFLKCGEVEEVIVKMAEKQYYSR